MSVVWTSNAIHELLERRKREKAKINTKNER
jgi:hypothetical protein